MDLSASSIDPAHNTMEQAMSPHVFAILSMTQRFAPIDLRETPSTQAAVPSSQAIAPLIFR
jgi:hypothetical protein